jgi:hypothetical protein
MSTTPDPTPFDETPVQATPVDPIPPVDPSLAGPESEPLLGEVPPAAAASDPEPGPRPSLSETSAAMREADLKALYAFAGFTELALGAVRSTVTDTQRWANARLAELRFRRQELTRQSEQVRKLADALPEDVKAVPEVAKGRVTELQDQVASTYDSLADRGQRVLKGVRSDVTGRIDPAFDKIQERIDAARQLIKSRAAAAAAAAPATTPQPAATGEPTPLAEEFVPESPVSDGVLVEDVASEPLPSTDEVISPAGHGDEVPPTFDAPADRQV